MNDTERLAKLDVAIDLFKQEQGSHDMIELTSRWLRFNTYFNQSFCIELPSDGLTDGRIYDTERTRAE